MLSNEDFNCCPIIFNQIVSLLTVSCIFAILWMSRTPLDLRPWGQPGGLEGLPGGFIGGQPGLRLGRNNLPYGVPKFIMAAVQKGLRLQTKYGVSFSLIIILRLFN